MSQPVFASVAVSSWVALASQIRFRPEQADVRLIERFLAESHRLALCVGCQAWGVREACYRLLLTTALDASQPRHWRELCQQYAWQALEELQRLGCALGCPHQQQQRLRDLAAGLEQAVLSLGSDPQAPTLGATS